MVAVEGESVERIEIPLLPVQKRFLQAKERFVAIVSARAAGKTFVAVLLSILRMLDGQNVVYFVQNLDAWRKGGEKHLKHFLRVMHMEDRWKWNGSTYTGTLRTQWGDATFNLGTYENPDNIRGATEISLCVLDEFMLSKPRMLAAITPIMRGKDLKGQPIHPQIRAVSTPNMSSEWQLMVLEAEKNGITLLRANPTENVYVTQEQREMFAAGIFDEKLKRQELLGEILIGDNETALCQLREFSDVPALTTGKEPVYAGLDMAHSGDRDQHVFAAVQGLNVLDIHEFGKADADDVAFYIRKFNEKHKITLINMDAAWSESIFDKLKFAVPCHQMFFGAAAEDKDRYANVRAELGFRAAAKVRNGLYVPEHCLAEEVKRELCNIHWMQLPNSNKLIIEPKSDVRIRLGRSPDVSDALELALYDQPDDTPEFKTGIDQADDEYRELLSEIMKDE